MNNFYSKPLLFIAVASLVVILFIVAAGTLQGRYSFFLKRGEGSLVLGISDKSPLNNISTESFENLLEGALETSKDAISQKVVDTEVKLKNSLEKEVSELTSSQINSIKLKICQDWGVIPTTTLKSD